MVDEKLSATVSLWHIKESIKAMINMEREHTLQTGNVESRQKSYTK